MPPPGIEDYTVVKRNPQQNSSQYNSEDGRGRSWSTVTVGGDDDILTDQAKTGSQMDPGDGDSEERVRQLFGGQAPE